MPASLSSVVTMGFSIDSSLIGDSGLVVSMGYGLSGALPPPPTPPAQGQPYGPALTPWERQRWFGDYESPLSKEERKKRKEYEKRLELGIIKELVVPKELKAEVKEVIHEAVREAVFYQPQINEAELIQAVASEVARDLLLSFKESKEARAIKTLELAKQIEDEEEDEAMEIASIVLFQ